MAANPTKMLNLKNESQLFIKFSFIARSKSNHHFVSPWEAATLSSFPL